MFSKYKISKLDFPWVKIFSVKHRKELQETPNVWDLGKSCNVCIRQSLNGVSERRGRKKYEKNSWEFSQLAEKKLNYKLRKPICSTHNLVLICIMYKNSNKSMRKRQTKKKGTRAKKIFLKYENAVIKEF